MINKIRKIYSKLQVSWLIHKGIKKKIGDTIKQIEERHVILKKKKKVRITEKPKIQNIIH